METKKETETSHFEKINLFVMSYNAQKPLQKTSFTLTDLYWLLGIEDRTGNETRKALSIRQTNMAKYIKYADIDSVEGFEHNFVGLIWLIYAFSQTLSQASEKSDREICIFYDSYDLWESHYLFYLQYLTTNTNPLK